MTRAMQDAIDEALFFDIPDMVKALKCSERHLTNLRKARRIPQPVKRARGGARSPVPGRRTSAIVAPPREPASP
jgi:hypothetical protein